MKPQMKHEAEARPANLKPQMKHESRISQERAEEAEVGDGHRPPLQEINAAAWVGEAPEDEDDFEK